MVRPFVYGPRRAASSATGTGALLFLYGSTAFIVLLAFCMSYTWIYDRDIAPSHVTCKSRRSR